MSGTGLSTPDIRGQFLIVPPGNTAYVSARRSRQARGLNRNRRTAFSGLPAGWFWEPVAQSVEQLTFNQ
jgi:hypothetical protein